CGSESRGFESLHPPFRYQPSRHDASNPLSGRGLCVSASHSSLEYAATVSDSLSPETSPGCATRSEKGSEKERKSRPAVAFRLHDRPGIIDAGPVSENLGLVVIRAEAAAKEQGKHRRQRGFRGSRSLLLGQRIEVH